MKYKLNSWWTSLFSCIKCLCKPDRDMKMQERAVELFEMQLDIRSLVKTRIDLSILLTLLLSKQQQLLFKNQHARVFATKSKVKKRKAKSRSIEDDFDSLQEPEFINRGKKGMKGDFDGLMKGYKVQTELDRKLILGVWKHAEEMKLTERSQSQQFNASQSIQLIGLNHSGANFSVGSQLVVQEEEHHNTQRDNAYQNHNTQRDNAYQNDQCK